MKNVTCREMLRAVGTTSIVLAIASLSPRATSAATINWKSSVASNDFNTAVNWNGNVAPGSADTAQFNNSGSYSPYFSTTPTTTAGLDVAAGAVSFYSLSGANRVYNITGTTAIRGGASLTVFSGQLLTMNCAAITVQGGTSPSGSLLYLKDGNKITATSLNVAQTGGDGTVIIEGSNPGAPAVLSTLSVTGTTVIGQNGNNGNVILQSGAVANFGALSIDSTGATGTVGKLTVQIGADAAVSGNISLGDASAGQNGNITVTGAGSSFTQTGATNITQGSATAGASNININVGGAFSTGTGNFNLFSTGTVNLGAAGAGNGGTFTENGTLNVNGGTFNSINGTATFNGNANILNGGIYNMSGGALSMAAGKTFIASAGGQVLVTTSGFTTTANAYTVTGVGSKWKETPGNSFLQVNNAATFAVSAGGQLATDYLFVGNGTAGTVTVDGFGSSLVAGGPNTGSVDRIGFSSGAGSIIFTNQAAGSFSVPLRIGESASNGGGTLNVLSGSNVTTGDIILGPSGTIGAGSSITVGSTTGVPSTLTQSGTSLFTLGSAGGALISVLNVNNNGVFTTGTGATTINANAGININTGSFISNGDLNLLGGSFAMTAALGGSFTPAANHSILVTSGSVMQLAGDVTSGSNSFISVSGSGTQIITTALFGLFGTPFDEFRLTGGTTMQVNAAGKFTIGGRIEVGQSGNATLAVDGATTNITATGSNASVIGQDGTGVMTLSNLASGNFKTLIVGNYGTGVTTNGTLNVLTSATLTTNTLQVGLGLPNGSTGTINLSGPAATSITVNNGFTSFIGSSQAGFAHGQVNVTGGVFTDGGNMLIQPSGTFFINGGTYNAHGPIGISGGKLQLQSGTFNWTAGNTMLVSNGGTFVYNNFYTLPVGSTIKVQDQGSFFTTNGNLLTVTGGAILNPYAGGAAYVGPLIVTATGNGPAGYVDVNGAGAALTATSTTITNVNFNSSNYATSPQIYIEHGAVANLGNVDIANTPGGPITTQGTLTVANGGTATVNNLNMANLSQGGGAMVSVYGQGALLHITGDINFSPYNANPDTFGVGYGGSILQGTSTILTGIPAQIGSGVINNYGTQFYINGGSVAIGNGYDGQYTFTSGNLGFDDFFDLGGSNQFPLSLDLTSGMSLAASKTAYVEVGSTLTLDGGSISASDFVFYGAFKFNSGTLAFNSLASGPLVIGSGGFFGNTLNLTAGKTVVSEVGTTVSSNGVLTINGGSLITTALNNTGTVTVTSGQLNAGVLTNQHAGTISISDAQLLSISGSSTNAGHIILGGPAAKLTGISLLSNLTGGVITGEGVIDTPVTNAAGAQIFAATGKSLVFTQGLTNAGQVNLNNAEIDVQGGFNNSIGGTVNGRGTLNTDGINNSGLFQLSAGLTDIYGNVVGNSASKILVSGGSTSTFYNNVTMLSGSELRVSTNSTAVFFGAVTGTNFFTGTGIKDFESGISFPGLIATPGSTYVEDPAIVTATAFQEAALIVAGHANVTLKNGGLSKSISGVSILGSLTMDPGGVLDLTNNDMVVHNGDLSNITNNIKSGYNSGLWNGVGITSSAAAGLATHLTALGVISNSNAGNPIYGASAPLGLFDGVNTVATDVLVRYTYYGDANLDGKVDGSDYSRVDNGYLAHASTWYNGDFNYDGLINGSDYTLMDNAYNTQGAALSSEIATVAAQLASPSGSPVPEPAALGLFALAVSGALSRRRR